MLSYQKLLDLCNDQKEKIVELKHSNQKKDNIIKRLEEQKRILEKMRNDDYFLMREVIEWKRKMKK